MLSNDFCACITTNIQFKFFFVLIFGIILTFIDNIDVLRNKYALSAVLFLLIIMSFTHLEEIGSVILVMILFVLLYNIVYTTKQNAKEDIKENSK
jgi:hypothetical protein